MSGWRTISRDARVPRPENSDRLYGVPYPGALTMGEGPEFRRADDLRDRPFGEGFQPQRLKVDVE